MKKAVTLLAILFTLIAADQSLADNIGFGLVKGIKVYDYTSSKVTKIQFADDATQQNVSGCGGLVTITHSAHSEEALKQMIALVTSAYIAGLKVRFASVANTCEADFMAIQETVF